MWCVERLLRERNGLLPGCARSSKTRSSIACANVLTPDRIPEFCIPPRLEPSLAWAALRDAWAVDAGMHGEDRTDWDPRSQAALSLPHLPRARTAYGFCALLESPHTRRKESLFLGHPVVPAAALPARDTRAPAPRARRLLRAPDGLLSCALHAPRGPARARSVSSGHEDEDDDEHERGAHRPSAPADPSRTSPSTAPARPERLQAEASVALGRAGDALRLAAEYWPRSARLRIRLLRAEGPAAALEPRALGCRLSLLLRSPGQQRARALGRSRKAAFDQDFCFDGLAEDQLRRLALCVKAKSKGRGLERGRPLGQGELPLGSLLLL